MCENFQWDKAYAWRLHSLLISMSLYTCEDTYVIEVRITRDRKASRWRSLREEKCSERTCNKRKIKDKMIVP